MKSKEERKALRAEHKAERKENREKAAAERKAKSDAKMQELKDTLHADKHLTGTRDDYEIKVEQNMSLGGLDTTQLMRYRGYVMVKETGEPLKTVYDLTAKGAWRRCDGWLSKHLR
jgi:hypothetical protein